MTQSNEQTNINITRTENANLLGGGGAKLRTQKKNEANKS